MITRLPQKNSQPLSKHVEWRRVTVEWFGFSDKPLFAAWFTISWPANRIIGGWRIPGDTPGRSAEKRDMLYQFYDSFQTSDELLEKYRDLMNGIASLRFLAGFCYTQLTDIEQEINGLLTYHRQPKLPAEQIAIIHREVFGEQPFPAQET